ncbi:hypothetical protein VT06_13280 [Arsukibacterium sp. MJ3]|uniref:CRISPR system precrRNA processing endoribonuclease RAMP protein Cas6 n=1 Tax=Arsukibacterium sp. MJ3 TaxID=1632859 RepID=UPI0006273ED2|nr:CRISPR system precrRNA processing endoribonuclease RAMP protein Cas6 [Arsukibacterium sp. MJ3]KKO48083.1 hypothetical protein VT06_13280 [Arsukibacterium sp. MJ3]
MSQRTLHSVLHNTVLHNNTLQGQPQQDILLAAAANVPYSHWQIALRFNANAELDAYKGNVLHGGFGRALALVCPQLYSNLFGQQGNNNRKACPFMLYCTDVSQSHYAGGEQLVFELRLYAQDPASLTLVRRALLAWQQLGLGKQRTQFKLLHITNHQGERLYSLEQGELLIPCQLTLATLLQQKLQVIPAMQWQQAAATYYLETISRCRIQLKGQPLTAVPPAHVWINAVVRRFLGLLAEVIPSAELAKVINITPTLPAIQLVSVTAQFSDWQKYSVKDQRQVSIGGLAGHWGYAGITATVYSYLLLGEYIGIGNKTSFGFGCYQSSLGFSSKTLSIQ